MTSYPKDSAGVDFDPGLHQTMKGVPRLTKAGRYIVQARKALKQRGSEAPRPPKPEAVEGAKAEAPKPEASGASPVELAPELREIAAATPEEILGSSLPPVTVQPDAEPPPASTAPEAPAPDGPDTPLPPPVAEGSFVAPDAPGTPVADAGLKSKGLAAALIGVGEMSARVGIDADECELNPVHREALIDTLSAGLEHSNLNPNTGPWGDFALTLIAVSSHHAAKPKTRKWLAEKWAFIKVKWFGAKPPADLPPPVKAD